MEKELRRIFGDSELLGNAVFCGKMLLGKLDDDVRAKIEFINTHISKHYDALRVTILNRTEGSVDVSLFKFVDIIGVKNGYAPYFWDAENFNKWYGFTPTAKDYALISNTVHDYMSMFIDQDIAYEMRM